jgi:adenine deaminase
MTLSFLALLVIPALKLSNLGLFDGRRFEFVPVVGAAGRGGAAL